MKKLIMLLVVLMAVPAFAVVEITATLDGTTVTIGYTGADPCNPPRAFALDLTATGGATIALVTDSYKLDGESNSASRGYGIYPARIDINDIDGSVDAFGTPEADPCDPGANASGSHLVLEFGSLYYGDVNAPVVLGVTDGNLCQVEVTCAGDANLVIKSETTYRGGVLLEDGNAPAGYTDNMVLKEIEICVVADCFPGGPGNAAYDEWASVGEPDCWCVSENPRQCHGDADGLPEGKGNYWTSFNDLTVLKAAWNKNYATIAGQTAGTVPTKLICADFDQTAEGKGLYRVSFGDLEILKANWNQGNLPDPNCTN